MSWTTIITIYLTLCVIQIIWANYRLVLPKWAEYLFVLNIVWWITSIIKLFGDAQIQSYSNKVRHEALEKVNNEIDKKVRR